MQDLAIVLALLLVVAVAALVHRAR